VNNYIDSLKRDKPCKIYWQNCLKDERRLLEKLEEVSTRIFSASSFQHLFARRVYFQSLVENMMSDPVGSLSAMGINVHSKDWDLLRRRLFKWGSKTRAFPGDFKRYDGSINRLLNK